MVLAKHSITTLKRKMTMNTNKHPLADVAFLARSVPVGTATRGSNFAPRVFDNVSTVRSNPSTWLKERGATEFVKVS